MSLSKQSDSQSAHILHKTCQQGQAVINLFRYVLLQVLGRSADAVVQAYCHCILVNRIIVLGVLQN